MLCPKCLANVPDAPECAKCGVIIAKFLALKAQPVPAGPAASKAPDDELVRRDEAQEVIPLGDEVRDAPLTKRLGNLTDALPIPQFTVPKMVKRALFVLVGLAIPIYLLTPRDVARNEAGSTGAGMPKGAQPPLLTPFLLSVEPPEDLYVDFQLDVPMGWLEGYASVKERGTAMRENMLPLLIIFYKGSCCGDYDRHMSPDEHDTLSKVVKVKMNADLNDEKSMAEGLGFNVSTYPAAFVIPKPGAPPIRVEAGEDFISHVRRYAGLSKVKVDGLWDYDKLARVALNGSDRAAEAYMWAGLLATAAYDQPKATQYFEESLALENRAETRFHMIWMRDYFKQKDKALEAANEFVQNEPDFKNGVAYYARAYVRQQIDPKAPILDDLKEACARGYKQACPYK